MLHRKAAPARTHAVSTVDGFHVLHVAEYGAHDGAPIVYLHGGPGGGIPPDAPRLFDPDLFRVIVFDQRGCGRSTCDNRLRANTTDLLIDDIETIRQHLGIERWAVMGSSYGALLTALYSARHAPHVSWAIVHGAFLGTHAEVEWLYCSEGAARFYPKQWDEFLAAAPAYEVEGDVGDADGSLATPARAGDLAAPKLVARFHRALTADSVGRAHPPPDGEELPATALAAAAALTLWEDDMETLVPMPATHEPAELVAGAQIAAHYFYHGCHLAVPGGAHDSVPPPDVYTADGILPELRGAAEALARVPCAIVHGRHDVVCPPRAAHRLHAAWPHSTLRIVEGGAHALFEKPMRAAAQAALAELVAPGGDGEMLMVPGGGGAPAKRRRA